MAARTGKQFAGRALVQDRHLAAEHDLLPLSHHSMKRHLFTAISAIVLFSTLPLSAQAPDANEQQQLITLAKEIQAQQAQMSDNQTKIEAKLTELAETIRVARLFAGKGGK